MPHITEHDMFVGLAIFTLALIGLTTGFRTAEVSHAAILYGWKSGYLPARPAILSSVNRDLI